jgi:hypothetical protein
MNTSEIFTGVYNAGINAGYTHEVAKSLADKAVKRERVNILKQAQKALSDYVVIKSKKWVSTHETGSHLLIDGKGNVLAGAGGKLTKKPENKPEEKKAPKKQEKKKENVKGEKLKIDWSPITDEIKDAAKYIENLPTKSGTING